MWLQKLPEKTGLQVFSGKEIAMTKHALYNTLKREFRRIVETNHLFADEINITSVLLTPEEAIGAPKRTDFPILLGKESMISAEYGKEKGQAYTSAACAFSGTLEEILAFDIEHDEHNRALFIAALNAVTKKLGLSDHTVHCKNGEPDDCAVEMEAYIRRVYGNPKITQVGYQPALLERLSRAFSMRILDLNADNIGKVRFGVKVEHGVEDFADAVSWADLILCTGSTLCNGTIVNFLNLDKEVLYFGTTLSGAAPILGLKRACFQSR